LTNESIYDGEVLFLQIGEIRPLSPALKGKPVEGEVVAARVAADGSGLWVLRRDGTAETNAPTSSP